MADEERLLKILLKYVTDVRSVEQAKAAADKLKQAEKEAGTTGKTAGEQTAQAAAFAEARMALLEKRTRLVNAEVERLKRTAGALQQVSTVIGGTGALIAGPLVAAATAYVAQAGRAEETSKKWGRATAQIAEAYQDVGRVAARTLLPYLERAADLAQSIARFAEAHPEAVEAALGIGGGLVALGALGTIAAQGIRLYADVKLLAAAALQNSAADKMLLAAQAQAGAAGLGGGTGAGVGTGLAAAGGLVGIVAATFAAMQYLGWRAYRGDFGAGPQVVTRGALGNADTRVGIGVVAAGAAGNAFAAPLSRVLDNFLYRFQGGSDVGRRSTNQSQSRTPGPRVGSLADAVPLFIAYQEQLVAAERDYGQRKTQIVLDYVARGIAIEKDYQETRTRLAADFAKSQSRALRDFLRNESRAQSDYADRVAVQLRDFARSEARAEESYYQQRLQRARDFDLETQRAEEDHQDRLRQFQEDHADRARELAGAQDALGLVKEQRRYEKERRQEEDEYAKSARRRNEDYARELADAETAFRQQREQRLADFEQQQADQKEQFQKDRASRLADFRLRRADEREDFQQRLADLATERDRLKAQNETNFRDQLAQNDRHYAEEKARLTADFKDRLNQLDAALLGEQKKRQDYYRRMAIDLEDWLRALRNGQPYTPRRDNQYPQPGATNDIPKQNPAEALLAGRTSGGANAGGSAALTVNFANAFQGAAGKNLIQAVQAAVSEQLTAAFDQFAASLGSA